MTFSKPTLSLAQTIQSLLPQAIHPFHYFMQQKGQILREQGNRKTQSILLNNQPYILKQQFGVGWKEIVKNLLYGRLPIISAKTEWLALKQCEALNISAPRALGFGEQGYNPAKRRSFVLMETITATASLETLTQTWSVHPPTFAFKQWLLQQVAHITQQLHQHHLIHRDLYICHFLYQHHNHRLFLIDLHRMQIKKDYSKRWRIKDLAALYFSTKTIGLTQRDYLRFLKDYRQKPLRYILQKERAFWTQVIKRGEKLYREHQL